MKFFSTAIFKSDTGKENEELKSNEHTLKETHVSLSDSSVRKYGKICED